MLANKARCHPATIAAPNTFNLGQWMCLQKDAVLYDYAAKCINSTSDSAACILYSETGSYVHLPAAPKRKTKVTGAL